MRLRISSPLPQLRFGVGVGVGGEGRLEGMRWASRGLGELKGCIFAVCGVKEVEGGEDELRSYPENENTGWKSRRVGVQVY
jgi:hypothetical protein